MSCVASSTSFRPAEWTCRGSASGRSRPAVSASRRPSAASPRSANPSCQTPQTRAAESFTPWAACSAGGCNSRQPRFLVIELLLDQPHDLVADHALVAEPNEHLALGSDPLSRGLVAALARHPLVLAGRVHQPTEIVDTVVVGGAQSLERRGGLAVAG